MKEINEANNKVEQLVKVIGEIGEKTAVIDEIVFQTKLLSFNASVEAERAGEHGRGFAVVAQEVGNLAQMSGKAATEISGIVKESIKSAEAVVTDNKRKVEVGSGLVNQSAQVLQQMKKAAEQMAASARQIMNASKEQSTGVKQVSLAMDNLNKATQDTAATAEEAAGAGEELSAQATHLDGYVGELAKIIHGDSVKEVSAQKPARAEHPSAPVHAEGGSAKVHKLQPRKKSQAAAQPMKKAAGAELLSVPSMNGGDQDEWEKL
jgi:methyl-accepting chemotaxis protein